MALYAMGDLHLSFQSDKNMDIFGKVWRNHDKQIDKNCNKLITDDDTLVLVGDHSWGRKLEDCQLLLQEEDADEAADHRHEQQGQLHFPDLMGSTHTWVGSDYPFDIIGQVSQDMSTIVIPLPVDTGYTYSNGENVKIYACDAESVCYDLSSITLTKTANGYVCEDYGLISYIKGAGYVEYYDPPFTLVKK